MGIRVSIEEGKEEDKRSWENKEGEGNYKSEN
jgi:hypothetical protein